jgi:protein-tyrosine kinase
MSSVSNIERDAKRSILTESLVKQQFGQARDGEPVLTENETGQVGETASAGDRRLLELDFETLGSSGYLTPGTMKSPVAEEFRIIKRKLLKNAGLSQSSLSEPSNIIAVTSAIGGEGKTFTTLNLAMSVAMERDISVLVIDTDLVARSLTKILQTSRDTGLSELLINEQHDVRNVILKVNVGNWGFIPAGKAVRYPSELIASERMKAIVREVATRYNDRIILLDTSPLLTSSLSVAISDLAGQVIVVVEEGKTSQQTIRDAISLIPGNKTIGMVLNKCAWAHNTKIT